MKCLTKKEHFLSNKKNEEKIIESICEELENIGLTAVVAEADADTDIVRSGIEKLNTFPRVIVVGNDTDLLILLVSIAPENKHIYFCKEVGGKNPSSTYFDIAKLKNSNQCIGKLLLFAQDVSGCDTTLSFFAIGKIRAVELIKTKPEAKVEAASFIDENATKEILIKNGEQFVLSMYGLSKYKSLNEARYFRFAKLTTKSSLKSNFDLAKLPPTSEACRQHILRVYLQVQYWLGNKMQPTDWGWRYEYIKYIEGRKKVLRPIPSTKAVAFDDLLSIVSCSCKTGCGNFCGCRKSSLACSAMCELCNGLSCSNAQECNEDLED